MDSYKDNLKDSYDKDDKGKHKIKLLKVVSVSPAKDNKDLKKVVVKYRATTKPDKDDDEIWKKEKDYTSKIESYMTLYLYKGKVIGQGY